MTPPGFSGMEEIVGVPLLAAATHQPVLLSSRATVPVSLSTCTTALNNSDLTSGCTPVHRGSILALVSKRVVSKHLGCRAKRLGVAPIPDLRKLTLHSQDPATWWMLQSLSCVSSLGRDRVCVSVHTSIWICVRVYVGVCECDHVHLW